MSFSPSAQPPLCVFHSRNSSGAKLLPWWPHWPGVLYLTPLSPRSSDLAHVIRHCEDVIVLDPALFLPLKYFFLLSYFGPEFLYMLSYYKSSMSYRKVGAQQVSWFPSLSWATVWHGHCWTPTRVNWPEDMEWGRGCAMDTFPRLALCQGRDRKLRSRVPGSEKWPPVYE